MYTIILFDRSGNAIRIPSGENLDLTIFQAKANLNEDPTYQRAYISDSEGHYIAKLTTRKDGGSNLYWYENGKWSKAKD